MVMTVMIATIRDSPICCRNNDDDDYRNDLFRADAEINGRSDLFREILRDEAVARLIELGKVIDFNPQLQFLTYIASKYGPCQLNFGYAF